MAQRRLPRVIASAMVLIALEAPRAAADEIFLGFVTCIPTVDVGAGGCPAIRSGTASWRVWNLMDGFDSPFPRSNDLNDVSLDFQFAGAALSSHWDVILPGQFVETAPFDISLLNQFMTLRLDATLSRTVFDPLFTNAPFTKFIADSAFVSATGTSFPPPLDFFAHGQFAQNPVPEPATLTLLGLGLFGITALWWRERRRFPALSEPRPKCDRGDSSCGTR
jgi:hypothetical protein